MKNGVEKEIVSEYEKALLIKLNEKESVKISSINARKVSSAFNSQISGLEGHIVDLEIKVSEFGDKLSDKIMPTVLIEDNKTFINGINKAQAELNTVELELEKTKETLAYYQGLRKLYFGQ